jgi:hypothetical protein
MPISTYTSYKDKTKTTFPINVYKNLSAATFNSAWLSSANAGAAPSTAEVCDNTTTGALNKQSSIGLSSYDWRLNSITYQSLLNSQLMIFDRLSHQGGLSTTTTSTQTTNLPTAALTRYTNGRNVMAALEFYTTNSGGVSTTATVSYTNQDGTSGQTSKPFAFGGGLAGRLLIMPLADGDTGVRSVESVTIAADTTVSSNFGVTLIKFLGMVHPTQKYDGFYGANSYNAIHGGGCHFEPILPGACLQLLNNLGAAGNHLLTLHFLDVT